MTTQTFRETPLPFSSDADLHRIQAQKLDIINLIRFRKYQLDADVGVDVAFINALITFLDVKELFSW